MCAAGILLTFLSQDMISSVSCDDLILYLELLVKLATSDVVELSMLCLDTLAVLAESEEIKVIMASVERGLLPRLTSVLNRAQHSDGHHNTKLSVLSVFRNLASSTNSIVLTAVSSSKGLLSLLIHMSMNISFWSVCADINDADDVVALIWAVLHGLSVSVESQQFLVNPDLGFVSMVVTSLDRDDLVGFGAALQLLQNLSTDVIGSAYFTAADSCLVRTLMNIVADGEMQNRLVSLRILVNMSVASTSKVSMAVPELGLISLMRQLVNSSDLEISLAAFDIICNLVDECEQKMLMELSNFDWHSLLPVPSRDGTDVTRLTVLSKFSLTTKGSVLLLSANPGLIAPLHRLSCGYDNPMRSLASEVFERLLNAETAQAINIAALRVSKDYGIPLDLFAVTVLYQLNVLNAQIQAATDSGMLSVFKQATKEKAALESSFAFVLTLRLALPEDFASLTEPATQSRWIKQKLHSHSVQLMRASDHLQLAAYEGFVLSLPSELQGNNPFAVILGDHVAIGQGDSVVADGLYCDGPVTTPVKIKLRRRVQSLLIDHEHKIMETFHKLAQTAVVTPFAIAQTSDR